METMEITADNSMTHESISGVPSTTSYNDHASLQPSDTGSVASNSLQGTVNSALSPARSTRASDPISPASAGGGNAVPSLASSFQQQHSVDLLDSQASGTDPHAHGYPTNRDRSGLTSSDDDHTEPSSSATGNTGENPAGYTRSDLYGSATSTFGRLIESTKKRLNSSDRRRSSGEDDDDSDEEMVDSALIYGYLQKLGRNGKWQTRWFETDGECLTYYKSSKRTKLLATLDLAKVGSIVMNGQDGNETTFTINISERPYHLRADSTAACKDWVITLNRVKEARMREGNVKLALPSDQPPDLLDHNYTPRIVVVANRQRTRAIDDEEIKTWEHGHGWHNNPANDGRSNYMAPSSGRLARWQKPRTSFARLASKLAKWARSIRKYGCADAENHVVLDHHLHPPGHDDKKKRTGASSPTGSKSGNPDALSSDRGANAVVSTAPLVGDDNDEEDDDVRFLS